MPLTVFIQRHNRELPISYGDPQSPLLQRQSVGPENLAGRAIDLRLKIDLELVALYRLRKVPDDPDLLQRPIFLPERTKGVFT